jgi:uncharacterized protein
VTTAFVDTGYWLAAINANDDLRAKALALADKVIGWQLVTTDWVLVELLNAVSRRGTAMRRGAVNIVERVFAAREIEVIAISSEGFASAVRLYKARPDKFWSLTDCASIEVMQRRKIVHALAHDRHFEQAGFRALLR